MVVCSGMTFLLFLLLLLLLCALLCSCLLHLHLT